MDLGQRTRITEIASRHTVQESAITLGVSVWQYMSGMLKSLPVIQPVGKESLPVPLPLAGYRRS